jgi:hypothetical protein
MLDLIEPLQRGLRQSAREVAVAQFACHAIVGHGQAVGRVPCSGSVHIRRIERPL